MSTHPVIAPEPNPIPSAGAGRRTRRLLGSDLEQNGSLLALARWLGRRAARETLQSDCGTAATESTGVNP